MIMCSPPEQLVEDVAAVYLGATVVCTAHYIE